MIGINAFLFRYVRIMFREGFLRNTGMGDDIPEIYAAKVHTLMISKS